MSPELPVYRGRFGPPQAERLLWRAGFGPRPGEASQRPRLMELFTLGADRRGGYTEEEVREQLARVTAC